MRSCLIAFCEPWHDFTTDPINQAIMKDWLFSKYEYVEDSVLNKAHIIAAFPLSVIATNRILNTAIARTGSANSLSPYALWLDLIAL